MAEDWSRDEVEAIVGNYFEMLRAELAGEEYSKTARRRVLGPQLNRRSDGSIEFKHANISAVLVGYGLPYIDGYKPRGNYQQLLEQVVLEYVASAPRFFERLLGSPVIDPRQKPPVPVSGFDSIREPAPEPIDAVQRVWSPDARVVHVDFVRRDAENRRLGRLGEEFVLELERKRLHDEAGRPELARQVEWTAQERGDGAGYDIRSFEADGRARYIEVKTTGLAKAFPFVVTANEVACSAALGTEYHLYRLFRFARNPGVYVLSGPLSSSCKLAPTQFRARFV